ncbi:dipeptide epimerase [Halanaeroarchaeum sulfurireducens]|uniref:Enolase superfamily enzyme related to L-alanine-DL-glutamate epimerase n=1 Tax=Halanaeroarchaeum sulfurireducens TaxID=1604004 RepID=A0A0F7PCF2_9EURY|nr:dipeptide epimerase [Halanaeroarchaeum sulfurireducens]AKH98377.1 enolase superfamily enzyme related to L-alanine-DL-glutamate epimerase [Halanaeroarchaeum sulfurireducens]
MTLRTSFERVEYRLEHPFTIARGTQETAENVVVRIEDEDGRVGVGGAAPSTHYGETIDTVEAVLPTLLDVVESVGDPHQLARIGAEMDRVVRDNPAAKAAVDVALHDLVAKRVDLPLYRYLGLDPAEPLETSYTIGIDDPETIREKTLEAVDRGFSTLKVKVGTDRDEEILETVREAAPAATIRVDANEGWTPREAVRNIEAIAGFDVEFVEQPIPAEHPEGLRYVYERSPLPIAVDESLRRASDVPAIAGRADIANLKLMKTGGIREAIRLIHAARAHGLAVMAGCMIESNASIAGAAHLAPLLDYVDLDGALLLAEDDFAGVAIEEGVVDLAALDRPGTGARDRSR